MRAKRKMVSLEVPPVTFHQTLFNHMTCLFPTILRALSGRFSLSSPSTKCIEIAIKTED